MNPTFRFLVLSSILFFSMTCMAQNPKNSTGNLKIYVDENVLDYNYLRNEIDFADFVNDPLAADVHIILVQETTGSGGCNYSIRFNSKTYPNIADYTLNVSLIPDETQHNIRAKLSNTIIRGLMPYLNETSSSCDYQLRLEKVDTSKATNNLLSDNWKNWVFRLSSSGGLNYEESKSSYNYTFQLTGDKVTDKIKINNYIYLNNRVTNYTDLDYVYRYNYKYAYTKGVYSLSDYWSTGLTLFSIQSSYYNKKFSLAALAAVEYNFFPWNESNEHIFSLAYSIGYESIAFYEKNYRGNFSENLPLHRLYLTASNIQPWGEISVNLTGSEYLTDLSLYNISFGADLSFRIVKGLSLTINMLAISIHDQIYIPENSYSLEEIISGANKLPTTFELSGSIGFTYQFGSIYNNVVNRRL